MAARGTLRIDDETRAILSGMTVDGVVAKLPPGQLPRSLYDKVNKALVALGGKWNRHKGGHVFNADPTALLRGGVETGQVTDEKKLYQFYETSRQVAATMAEIVKIRPGDLVLEPEAGHGRLAFEAERFTAKAAIQCIDLNPACVEVLVRYGFTASICGDFLAIPHERLPKYDVVLMNPPFANGQDCDHICHAWSFLKPGGRMAAICGSGALTNGNSKAGLFQFFVRDIGATVTRLEPGAFAESGTMVNAALIFATKAAS